MARRRTRDRKARAKKVRFGEVWVDPTWSVKSGELRREPGRPRGAKPLFAAVAEKIPYGALDAVRRDLRARDIGRGSIFGRLRRRRRAQSLELHYFSFFVVTEKIHEREIETLLIRAAGPQLHFNTRKKRVDIQPGSVRDFEAGTLFYERRYRRGKRPRRKRRQR
jgi:hypothetical protein